MQAPRNSHQVHETHGLEGVGWGRTVGELDAFVVGIGSEQWEDQVVRIISKAWLHPLPGFHVPPIDVVVYHDPDGEYWF